MRAIVKAVLLDSASGRLGVDLEVASIGEVTAEELEAIEAVATSPRKLLELRLEVVDWLEERAAKQ